MNGKNVAKYLVLTGNPEAPRAILFNNEFRYLSEMLDQDPLHLDHLVSAGRRCPPPAGLRWDEVTSPPGEARAVACFALGAADAEPALG